MIRPFGKTAPMTPPPDRTRDYPHVLIAGAGAAGLWCGIRLAQAGWPGDRITLVDPDPKTADDHTWSYWTRREIVPADFVHTRYTRVEVASGGERRDLPTHPYRYESIRSSAFYAYAKQVLAKAGAAWREGSVVAVEEFGGRKVDVAVEYGGQRNWITVDRVLDGRPPRVDVERPGSANTLQHFGGWFVETDADAFDPALATLMDFVPVDAGVGFFYVLPKGPREALLELAIFSRDVWPQARYDDALAEYVRGRYGLGAGAYRVREREYGVIPMTDQPLWEDGSARVWKIGTAGGWVQPSSGYAFTRCARYATEVVRRLREGRREAPRPGALEQVFNTVMLAHSIAAPERAGRTFLELFERNGAPSTFAFLDWESGLADTLRLMWRSPRREFTARALSAVGRLLTRGFGGSTPWSN